MAVRFEVDVEGSAAGFFPGSLEAQNLGVLQTRVGISPGSDHIALHRQSPRRRRDLARPVRFPGAASSRARRGNLIGLVRRHAEKIYHAQLVVRACFPVRFLLPAQNHPILFGMDKSRNV